jgi:hypothetical protein
MFPNSGVSASTKTKRSRSQARAHYLLCASVTGAGGRFWPPVGRRGHPRRT